MELLTGKCKEYFEKWYLQQEYGNRTGKELVYAINDVYGCDFYKMILSMQYGVYVDFFDSVGLNILITVEFDFGYIITENRYEEVEEVKKWYDTRQESQLEAIKKANELYNKNPNIK